jgi:phospholipase C
MINRRDAIKRIGGIAGAAGLTRYLPGCSSDGGPVGITTYVYMMMENRSYDHFFGSRVTIEGLAGDGPQLSATNLDLDGNPIALFPATIDHLCDPDPAHGWDASHIQWNNGANDGFVTTHQMEHPGAIDPMQYLTRTDVPVSYALADAYTVCDRWFCSVMGPTWPNRFYWHAGSSFGLKDNNLPSSLDQPSIYLNLQNKNIEWAYYYGNIPVVAAINNLAGLDTKVRRFPQFFIDAKAGTLPPVVYIDPAFASNDDHPPVHPINGQELIASVYQALAESPQWKNILFVLTYDEHGGFYDHVSPPQTSDDLASEGFDQLGFRVPAMVMGPYAKQNYHSMVQYDHTSPLKHLQNAFELDRLTLRSDAANPLDDCIDMDRLARGDWAPPIDLPTIDESAWPMGPECVSTGFRETDPISAWANANPTLVEAYDLRHEEPQYRKAIRDFLAERGLFKR